MNAKLSIVLLACAALFLSGCGSSAQSLIGGNPQTLILGKWVITGAQVDGVENESAAAAGKALRMSAEFHKDGTAKMTMMGQTMRGTYKINGKQLEWTMNGITTTSKLNVTATELEVTDNLNRTIKYRRP
jgi:hypothetical protein